MITRRKKLLVRASLLLVFVLLPGFVTTGVAYVVYRYEHGVIVPGKIIAADLGFKQEMQNALEATGTASKDAALVAAITNDDGVQAEKTLSILAAQLRLTQMTVLNGDGVVLSRSDSPRKNDLYFLTTPWGVAASKGQEVVTVGPGRNYPLIINGAIPIMRSGVVRGAVMGGYVLDDAYAAAFKDKYLKPGDQVAFYAVDTGVYGTSFQDPEVNGLFKLLFSDVSDAVLGEEAGLIAGHFKLGQTIFHVGNIKLLSADGRKVGGIFVLSPTDLRVPPIAGGLTGLFALLFLSMSLRPLQNKGKKYDRRVLVTFFCAIAFVGGVVWVVNRLFSGVLYDVKVSVYPIYNSTLTLYPDSDIFVGLDRQQKIGIRITTGGETVNAAQVFIRFDPAQVRIDDILMEHSFCDTQLVLQKDINNRKGLVALACFKPDGSSADRLTLAELVVSPLRPGVATLKFTSDSGVFANDGLGTNVLRLAIDGAYQFLPLSSLRTETTIFSFTHPNPTRWYRNNRIHLEWTNPTGETKFAYALDKKPDSIPENSRTTDRTSVDLVAPDDGIYYFHLRPLHDGRNAATSHLKIQVDTTPPPPPRIQTNEAAISNGDIPRLKFIDDGDPMSGLQKKYYIRFREGVWLPVLQDLNLPFLTTGQYKISLRIFDNAGNHSEASTMLNIK